MKVVKTVYKFAFSKAKSPNAIPSFQIKFIFKNLEEKISDPKNFLFREITYIFDILSIKKIDKIIKKLIIKFFTRLF